jgi:hypothetical protein
MNSYGKDVSNPYPDAARSTAVHGYFAVFWVFPVLYGSALIVLLESVSRWECGSGSRRAKKTPKNTKSEEISCFEVLVVLF